MDYRIISIGALSVHELWEHQGPARTAHATTTLVRSGDRRIVVDPGLPPPVVAARLSERAGLAPEDISDVLFSLNKLSPLDAAGDEELWARMAQAYTVSPTILNLNNGGVSPQPKVVQDAVDRYYHLSNEAPTYYMWQILDKGRESVRRKLRPSSRKSIRRAPRYRL